MMLFVFLVAYWLALQFNATFDVYFESPMGGIWMWSLHGLRPRVRRGSTNDSPRCSGANRFEAGVMTHSPRHAITTSWDDGHPLDLRLAEMLARSMAWLGTFYVPKQLVSGPRWMTAQLRMPIRAPALSSVGTP